MMTINKLNSTKKGEPIFLFFLFLSLFSWSCQSGSKNATTEDGIIKFDISKNYPKSNKTDADFIAEIEYVPLETNKDVLVDRYSRLHYISENYIMVTERGKGDILVFDRKGKIVVNLSRKGRGPEEYSAMSNVVIDEKNEEIFVFDNIGTGRVVVYSISNGEYLRSLRYPAEYHLTAYNFDDEAMLVYDRKGLNDNSNSYSKNPYMLMSKKDGSIISVINIHLSVRYAVRVTEQFTDSSGQRWEQGQNFSLPNRRHDGQDFIIADVSSDTIYRLTKNRNLIPFIVRTPSVHATEPHLVCTPTLITDKYIFLHVTTLDYVSLLKAKVPPAKSLIYEFETGEINSTGYKGSDTNILEKNIDARMLDMTILKDAYEANHLPEDLAKLVETLDEEDNPAIMIRKLK